MVNLSYILSRPKIVDPDGCWISTLASNNSGHVRVRIGKDRRRYILHRLAYCIYNDKKYEDDFLVRHKCNKPACFRKECLVEGTHSDNMLDSVKAGTHHLARRTHCPKGHLLQLYREVYPDRDGRFGNKKICQICRLEQNTHRSR